MTTPVVWLNLDPDALARGMWDQGFLDLVFDGRIARTRHEWVHVEARSVEEVPVCGGGVVVLPGRFHVERVDEVNEALARLAWVLLIVTSDEESLFPFTRLRHPRLRLWAMTPDPRKRLVHEPSTRFLGEMYASDTLEVLDRAGEPPREIDVAFAGQTTHPRRHQLAHAMRNLAVDRPDLVVSVHETDAFAAGFARHDYLRLLASSRIAPAPCGPATPDSFRFYEAIEAGCVPIVDDRCEHLPSGYWELLFGTSRLPFPRLDGWLRLDDAVGDLLDDGSWQHRANLVQAWWQREKETIVRHLDADVDELSGSSPPTELADRLTVVVPTSSIPAHPSTEILEETLASVRERLPRCRIVVVFDRPRPEIVEIPGRVAAWDEYVRCALRLFNFAMRDVTPVVLERWHHQATATRVAFDVADIRTPTVLFVEHDTPLCGEIPFDSIVDVVETGEANLVRLHHETGVLDPHRHLMLDDWPRKLLDVPLLATAQWSQRPHVASTAFYRDLLRRYFGEASRTMIEDVMHGVVQTAWHDGAWGMWRLFLYAPDGDMKRSFHLDGRGEDPKFEMLIDYDADRPPWGPARTADSDEYKQPGQA